MDEALESRILDLMYRGVADTASLRQALDMLAKAFSCASSALVLFDHQEPAAGLAEVTGIFAEESVLRRYPQFAEFDPAPAAFASLALGGASTTDRLLDAEFRRKSVFANEFYMPLGLSETAGANLFSERGRTALLGLHRGDERGAFTDAELSAIERMSPHLRRILQLRRQFVSLQMKSAAVEAVLDRHPAGIVLADSRKQILFVNHAMQVILRRGDGFFASAGALPMPHQSDARQRLQYLVDDVLRGGAGGAVRVPCAKADRSYQALLARAPRSAASDGVDPAHHAAVILIVHDPMLRAPARVDIVRDALGLTEGAAQLAVALAEDDDLRSFAERNAITIHTARFHLRTLFVRTGVKTQAELSRLVVRLLRDAALALER